ncbi:unnamed protein product [Effrenium voratum]|nr:unnamed protein product [Effrenium voratum]
MISRKAPFKGIKLARKDFHVLGTPAQVAEWCADWPHQPRASFVFDLDGTLVTPSGKPIERNLTLFRRLKKQGHHVAVWTERPAEAGAQTIDLLQKLGVECPQMVMESVAVASWLQILIRSVRGWGFGGDRACPAAHTNYNAGFGNLVMCAAYMAIPLKIALVASRPTCTLFRNITQFSKAELSRVRALGYCFALFLLCCGLVHGLDAHVDFMGCEVQSLLCRIRGPARVVSAAVSIGTSAAFCLAFPQLVAWANDIEIHRKGFLKVASESQDLEADEKLRSDGCQPKVQRESTTPSLGMTRRSFDCESLKQEVTDVCRGASNVTSNGATLQELPEKIASASGQKLRTKQVLALLAAIYNLHRKRREWSRQPEATWGAFHDCIKEIISGRPPQNMLAHDWFSVASWYASRSSEQIFLVTLAAIDFYQCPQPEQVTSLAKYMYRFIWQSAICDIGFGALQKCSERFKVANGQTSKVDYFTTCGVDPLLGDLDKQIGFYGSKKVQEASIGILARCWAAWLRRYVAGSFDRLVACFSFAFQATAYPASPA